VRRQWRGLGDRLGERDQRVAVERRRLEADDRREIGSDEARRDIAPRDRHEPRLAVHHLSDRREEVGRRVVHVVGVLDLDQRRPGEQARDQLDDDVAQPRGPELGRERFDLGGDRRVGVEGDRQERQPWQQRRVGLLDDRGQAGQDDVVGVVLADAEQRAQQLAPRGVRG
jgi:hypothetical protein